MSVVKKELARRELATRSLKEYIRYCDHENIGTESEFLFSNFQNILCEHIDAFITAVEKKGSPRLAIFAPPRHGKSEIISRNGPCYILGKHPKWELIAASATDQLASDFGGWVNRRLNSPLHQDLFPDMKLDPNKNSTQRVGTLSGGGYIAVGVGTQVVGKGAHIGIVDDPVAGIAEANSPIERARLYDWYMSNMDSRLSPGGGMLLMHQRWTTDDLAACLLAASKTDKNSSQWVVLSFPAIAIEDEPFRKAGEALFPERWDITKLNRIKADKIANGMQRAWFAMYQQTPYNDTGNFFKKENIKFWKTLPSDLTWLIAADYAVSKNPRGDKTAIVALGVDHAGNVYLGDDYYWGRWETMDIVTKTVSLGKKYDSRQLATENGPINATINPLLQREMAQKGHYMTLEKNIRRGNKMISAHALRGLMEAGNFYFPDTPDCHERIIPNVLRFDDGSDGDDDFVDALTNGAVVIDNVGKPLPPEKPKDEPWRKRGELYSDDIFKKKDKKEIKGLRGQW
jgi:hypothetical protein